MSPALDFEKAVVMGGWSVGRVLSGAVLALCIALGAGCTRPSQAQTPPAAGADAAVSDAVTHGAYLARAADCMPCHSGPGQPAFSGGLPIHTPFGVMVSPNITPAAKTGIGRWTDAEFYRLIHDGVGLHGKLIYPAMPFTSYTQMTRQDVNDIKAYLFSLKPVTIHRDVNQLAFPFNIRASLISWRLLFFQPGTYRYDPHQSAVWNRGAYLVLGAGHCGECHTPRNGLGAMLLGRSLSGGLVDGYYAPNISADPKAGLGARTVDQIKQFLHTGAEPHLGVAFGPMAEVVQYSTRYLTDADLTAMATYLLHAAKRPDYTVPVAIKPAQAASGQALYQANCAGCHQPNGAGVPNAIPNLAGNAAVTATRPNNVIAAMVNGLPGLGTYIAMPSFAGSLSDQNMADIANYVRTAWGNAGSANATPALVRSIRAIAKRNAPKVN